MWIVYDNENGIVYQGNDHEKAIKEYEYYRDVCKDYVISEGEFSTDETVILAKVEKHLYSHDSKEPVVETDENGNEYETKDTYWEFQEDEY